MWHLVLSSLFDTSHGWMFISTMATAVALFISCAFTIWIIRNQKKQLVELEEKQQAQAICLNGAIQKAEQAKDSKTRFLSDMSHEINTPLNAVLGMIQLLERTDPSDRQIHYIKTIKKNAKGLSTLTRDILHLSEIESDALLLRDEPIILESLLNDVMMDMAELASHKNLELGFWADEDAYKPFRSDRGRILQILLYLTQNAIKFTVTGSIHISATSKKNKNDERSIHLHECMD